MRRPPVLKAITPCLIAGALVTTSQPVHAQNVLDRLKKITEDAAKAAEAAKKATEAKKTPETDKTTPATPGGGNPNANSPNAATPASPAGGAGAGQSTPRPSTAKVEELALVSGQKLNVVVGPKGGHAAAVVLRGSRTVVMHDGVDGPRFDAIIGDSEGLAFSPDGSRLAYIARQGAEFVFVADGKELLRVPVAQHPRVGNTGGASKPQFTDNSKHVYFRLYSEPPGATGNGSHRLFIDGIPGPESFGEIAPVFAAGGDHHAYMVESPQKRGVYSLVVDGKPSTFAGGEPQMTADGLHVITKRVVPGTNATEVLLDGKPIMRAQTPQVYTTPVGSGFVTVVSQGSAGSGIQFLTMATQRVPGTDCPFNPGYSNVVFSSDARHWAAVCQASPTSYWVVADGKRGQDYQGIIPVGFADDGRFVYAASMRNQTFLVAGDQESEGYAGMISPFDGVAIPDHKPLMTVSPLPPPATLARNRIAFTAQNPPATMRTIVVDGKAMQRDNAGPVTFSPDGSRFAFTFGRPTKTLNVDGKDLPGTLMLFRQPAISGGRNRPRVEFTFSPDGKRVAYFEMQPNNSSAVYVDGRLASVFPGSQPENLTFTPDGRHLYWLAGTGNQQTVYVDGRPAVQFDGNQQLQLAGGTWEVGADGTLTIVAQAGDAIKRFRITPGADTGVDTIGK